MDQEKTMIADLNAPFKINRSIIQTLDEKQEKVIEEIEEYSPDGCGIVTISKMCKDGL